MIFFKRHLISTVGIICLMAGVIFYGWWLMNGRFIQSTDDAYIGANITVVASKVSGYISRIEVRDNQLVKAGDIILSLDDRDYRAAVAQSKAKVSRSKACLDSIRASITMQQSVIASAAETWQAAKLDVQKSLKDSQRYELLAKSAAISQQIKDNARLDYQRMIARERKAANDYQTEQQRLTMLSAQLEVARAGLKEAKSALDRALLDLEYTVVRAPITGTVANRRARVGSWVAGGTQLASVVPSSGLWIDANFKESQIAGMKPGMKAEIRADALHGNVFHGYVESLAPATGATFSLIPVENATGNFTKIVQRVPVRIAIDKTDELARILRPGLSVTVSVNERH
ncbi:HlyD family secretion protein [Citrobacter sp. A316]|uniref:HlyD family secretion protein n=1 Tax=Citrobacter sp. A316 TaxID=1639132 RepID=UPI0009AE08BF|nr:HlyD family secretion protein [Citrobacter sp. A316]OPW98074.1 hemolysin D [Citrobacter sp. A316]